MKLGELAERLGCRLEGDPEIEIRGVAGITEAGPGQLTFLANRRYRPAVKRTRAAAILIAPDAGAVPVAALRSENPYLDFARAIDFFHQPARYAPGIHPTAVIAKTARIGEEAHIGPYCFVDENVELGRGAVLHSLVAIYRDARIGEDFFAHAHAVVREGCRIGDRVILQNGAVVGGDGFGYARQASGRWRKIAQTGPVVIEDDVEIQANACVDRATVGETRIGRGTKIDDLVLVGHACKVGEDTLLCGQVGLAGSTNVGNRCIFAGQSASSGHLSVGDGAIVTSQSGLPGDVPPGGMVSGSPAVENRLWLRTVAALNHLPDILHRVRRLEQRRSAGRARQKLWLRTPR